MKIIAHPRPGYEHHRSHAHSHGPAVERIARIACQQHCIHTQGGRRAEDGPNVGGVYYPIDDDDTTGLGAHLTHHALCGTAHGTQHATREHVAGEAGQQLPAARIDRHVT